MSKIITTGVTISEMDETGESIDELIVALRETNNDDVCVSITVGISEIAITKSMWPDVSEQITDLFRAHDSLAD